ncbi:MAG: signal peptidase I [Parachlamydiaceae bacterium]
MKFFKSYSWNHCRSVLQKSYRLIVARQNELSSTEKEEAKSQLTQLQTAIEQKDRHLASSLADRLDSFCQSRLKKSWVKSTCDLFLALLIALIVATIVRQVWFELYEIPTGSMRPTFREQDHLTVSKTQFGINAPLQTSHYYFDPELVKRTGIVIFSGDRLPVIDSDTTFLGIFPYKKRYIKRMIGKPGDTLYFYGGKIYGIDREGHELTELVDNPALARLEHIPFYSFIGQVDLPRPNDIVFKQTNLPVARIQPSILGVQGEIFNGQHWMKEDLKGAKKPHDRILTLSDFWGIGNYGMTELLTKEELVKDTELSKNISVINDAELYLVIRHHPSLNVDPLALFPNAPIVGTFPHLEKSLIPLKKEHLDALMNNMYTMRFVVKDGRARRYSQEKLPFGVNSPTLENVPDGTYEFYYGKAYKVMIGGFLKELDRDHPLYSKDPGHIQKLYNLGMVMDNAYLPSRHHPALLPMRYAYFRNKDLYLLGVPIFKSDDPFLKDFLVKEEEKEKSKSDYIAFKDYGAPLKNGKFDQEFIKSFGLKIPEDNYYVLGDNHAMSSDSRVFGFVPEANLQGVPEFVLWPNTRFTNHGIYPIFVIPRIIVWLLMGIAALIWYSLYQYRLRRPIDLSKIRGVL